MKIHSSLIEVASGAGIALHDLMPGIREAVRASGIQNGFVTVTSQHTTTAIAINGQEVLKLCKDDPEFGFEFMHRAARVLAERLAATRLQLLEMGGVRLPEVAIESD